MMILFVIALSAVVVGPTAASTDMGHCTLEDPPKDICKDLPHLNFISNRITVEDINCGERVEWDFKERPQQLQWWEGAETRKLYTFLLIGRDSTENYTFHWGLSNIPGHFLRGEGDITEGHNYLELAYYVPVSVTHRFNASITKNSFAYLALIYRQTREISVQLNLRYTERRDFNLMDFAKKEGLCGPLAGVQAYASPEDLLSPFPYEPEFNLFSIPQFFRHMFNNYLRKKLLP